LNGDEEINEGKIVCLSQIFLVQFVLSIPIPINGYFVLFEEKENRKWGKNLIKYSMAFRVFPIISKIIMSFLCCLNKLSDKV
jgi:hypothetical protein